MISVPRPCATAAPHAVLPSPHTLALHGESASRRIEALAAAALPAGTLMARAGLSAARLAAALAGPSGSVVVVAGPGNNGGDGWEAAWRLQQAGRRVEVWDVMPDARRPADAARSAAQAMAAGVRSVRHADQLQTTPAVVVDALFGLGVRRPPEGAAAEAIEWMRQARHEGATLLAMDLPSGLHPDTGCPASSQDGSRLVQADHTLSLLTLKPGLFTGQGRAHAGRVWFDDLGAASALQAEPATAWLAGLDALQPLCEAQFDRSGHARHAAHKGTRGDVWLLGGSVGMEGALHLAATAAVDAAAGRIHAVPLSAQGLQPSGLHPEIMWRGFDDLRRALQDERTVLVAGCGGGTAIAQWLPELLAQPCRLVLDADALNALAADPALQSALQRRSAAGAATLLTPHPLEAARLAGLDHAQAVQADRLGHAQSLAERLGCVVVLKGSGTVVAAPGATPAVNSTGNARLATGGTGDVLAGYLGGAWAAVGSQFPSPFRLACACVVLHGLAVDDPFPPAHQGGAAAADRGSADRWDGFRAAQLSAMMARQLARAAHGHD